jgi:hypothetical protein
MIDTKSIPRPGERGFLLESVEHALLDEGWWRTFQPMLRRTG